MAGIQLSGLSSGLDTDSVISALLSVERQPRTRMVLQQGQAQAREQAYKDIQTRLNTLKSASDALSSVLTWAPAQTVESSDTTKVSARLTSGAGPGGYSVSVSQLAASAQRTYSYTAPTADTSLTINGSTYTVAAGSTLDSVVAQINQDSNSSVYAVNANGSMILATKATGSTATISASGGGMTEQASLARAGADAKYSLDGGVTTLTSSSNVISNAVAGVELTLKGITTGTTVSVSAPAVDQGAVTNALKSFVGAYNDAVGFIRGKVTEQTVPNPTTQADANKGVLFGDSGLNDLLSQLRSSAGAAISGTGNPSTMQDLASIGVSTGATTGAGTYNADSVAGLLTLDTTKLSAALSSDPTSVQRLLGAVAGTNGFSQSFSAVLTPYTQAAGLLDNSISSADSDIADLKQRIADLDTRLADRETFLRSQFTAMETSLNQLKSQGSSMINALNGSSSSG